MSVSLIISAGLGAENDSVLENWIEIAKVKSNYLSQTDSFEVVVVPFGDSSKIHCSEAIIQDDTSTALSILNGLQITRIPCVVVRSSSQVLGTGEVFNLDDGVRSTDVGSVDKYSDAGIAAYNEFDISAAVSSFEAALRMEPTHTKSLFNLASIMHMCDYSTLAVGFITRLLLIDPEDSIAHSFLWALNGSGTCTAATLRSYTKLAATGDLRAATKLATITGQGIHASKGDPSYAQRIYDEMADKFETKLVDHLGYKGPWLMRDLLDGLFVPTSSGGSGNGSGGGSGGDGSGNSGDSNGTSGKHSAYRVHSVGLRPKGDWRILDIGCGSGLCGKVFESYLSASTASTSNTSVTSDHSNTSARTCDTCDTSVAAPTPALTLDQVPLTTGGLMVGIDVSGKILEVARSTGKYHCAERWDLTEALQVLDCTTVDSVDSAVGGVNGDRPVRTGLDMVIAADTFIYVGALGEVFSLVHKVLRDGTNASGSASDNSTSGGIFMFSTEDLESSPMRVQPTTIEPTHTIDDTTSLLPVCIDSLEIAGAVPGWGGQLLKSARFAHADCYIRALCEKYQFRVLVHERIVLRTEETIPLPGNIYILQKI